MKRIKNTTVLAFAAGCASAASLALMLASGPENEPAASNMVKPGNVQPDGMQEVSPEDMMAQMAKLAQPGPEHKELGKMVGNWAAKASFVMGPDTPAMESAGTMSVEWVLGGRYTKSSFKMDFMGQPFEGLSYMGYDNAHGNYVSVWMDTMSTHITSMTGDKENGEMVMKGTSTTPMGDTPMKIVSKWTGPDSWTDEFYDKSPDGQWVKSGSIVYTRK